MLRLQLRIPRSLHPAPLRSRPRQSHPRSTKRAPESHEPLHGSLKGLGLNIERSIHVHLFPQRRQRQAPTFPLATPDIEVLHHIFSWHFFSYIFIYRLSATDPLSFRLPWPSPTSILELSLTCDERAPPLSHPVYLRITMAQNQAQQNVMRRYGHLLQARNRACFCVDTQVNDICPFPVSFHSGYTRAQLTFCLQETCHNR